MVVWEIEQLHTRWSLCFTTESGCVEQVFLSDDEMDRLATDLMRRAHASS